MALSWDCPYPSQRPPVFARNVVATSQPLAAQAGLRALQRGGNAIDAALATAITLTVVEPNNNGIGSDAFALVWDGSELTGLNASGRAPAAMTLDYFRDNGIEKIPPFGPLPVSVPGAVDGWFELHGRYGRLPMQDLLAPARHLRIGREAVLDEEHAAGGDEDAADLGERRVEVRHAAQRVCDDHGVDAPRVERQRLRAAASIPIDVELRQAGAEARRASSSSGSEGSMPTIEVTERAS